MNDLSSWLPADLEQRLLVPMNAPVFVRRIRLSKGDLSTIALTVWVVHQPNRVAPAAGQCQVATTDAEWRPAVVAIGRNHPGRTPAD